MIQKYKKRRCVTLMVVPGDQSRILSFKLPVWILVFGALLLLLLIGNTLSLAYQRNSRGDKLQNLSLESGNIDSYLNASIDLLSDSEAFSQSVNRLIGESENPSLQDFGSSGSFDFTHLEDKIAELNDKVVLANSVLQITASKNKAVQDILLQLPAAWPLSNGIGYVTQRYGYNNNPFNGLPYLHKGLDFGYGYGAPLVAVGGGVIEERGYDAHDYGNYVVIRHSFGYKTKYAHMQNVFVREGSVVKTGDPIGTMGATGKVTGPHLHLETYLGDLLINPEVFIEIRNKPRQY